MLSWGWYLKLFNAKDFYFYNKENIYKLFEVNDCFQNYNIWNVIAVIQTYFLNIPYLKLKKLCNTI